MLSCNFNDNLRSICSFLADIICSFDSAAATLYVSYKSYKPSTFDMFNSYGCTNSPAIIIVSCVRTVNWSKQSVGAIAVDTEGRVKRLSYKSLRYSPSSMHGMLIIIICIEHIHKLNRKYINTITCSWTHLFVVPLGKLYGLDVCCFSTILWSITCCQQYIDPIMLVVSVRFNQNHPGRYGSVIVGWVHYTMYFT